MPALSCKSVPRNETALFGEKTLRGWPACISLEDFQESNPAVLYFAQSIDIGSKVFKNKKLRLIAAYYIVEGESDRETTIEIA